MSFSDLKKANYTRKEKSFTIDLNGKPLEFKATELSHFQKVEVDSLKISGLPWLSKFVSYSIVDAHGVRMTETQAQELPEEYANKFITEAVGVNNFLEEKETDSEKKNKPA